MDRWYDNIDEKQHYELKNASDIPLLLIQNFKQGIYTVGIVVYHYQSSFWGLFGAFTNIFIGFLSTKIEYLKF